jgi:hypothetical protein
MSPGAAMRAGKSIVTRRSAVLGCVRSRNGAGKNAEERDLQILLLFAFVFIYCDEAILKI